MPWPFSERDDPSQFDPPTFDPTGPTLLPRLVYHPEAARAPGHVLQVLPGVCVVIVRDQRGCKPTVLDDEEIAELGGRRPALAQAVQNLRSLPPPAISDRAADKNRGDSTLHTLLFDDFFGASRVLIMHEVLAAMGLESPSHGVLFSVPTRQTILLHVLRGEGLVPAIKLLSTKTATIYAEGSGALSQHLFYWSTAGIEQVTVRKDDGSLAYQNSPAFSAALASLGLRRPSTS